MSNAPTSRPGLNLETDAMLIPESIADAPTQRFYATALFVFLQALKFYDYIQLYGAPVSAETAFAIKWICIDAVFLLLIPKLKIPWLSFGFAASFLQVAVISTLNICLSARIPISLSGIGAAILKIVYDRELSVLENNVKISDIIKNSSRILGKHTINILPESTAKFNPASACYCLDSSKKQDFSIPVRLNSTIPIYLQYSRVNPNTNELTMHNLTGKPLRNVMKHTEYKTQKVWELPLPITEPGLYRLERVQDSSRLDVRLYRSQALVVTCPSASLVIPEKIKDNPDRCTGDLDELSLRVTGLPPLRVKYNRWIEGRERVSTIESVKPLAYTSPLMISHHDQVNDRAQQQLASFGDFDDLTWAKSRSVDVHLNSSLATAGTWSYTIEEVEDACGNIINFSSPSRPSRNPQQKRIENNVELESLMLENPNIVEAPSYQFTVHDRPSIAFRGCDPKAPLKLLEGRSARISFDIESRDPGPFDVQLRRGSVDTLLSVSPEDLDHYKDVKLKSKAETLPVDEAGLYHIHSFSSKHCRGIVQMPASCVVYTPPRPSLAIAFEPILDKCAGSIGLLADLSFTGSPPFDITWRVVKDGRAMLHRKKIDRARHQLRFTPDEAGHFVYEFATLDDSNYKGETLNAAEYRTEQIVYPLAGASFQHREVKKCCSGESVELPVRLVGSGPWNLVYEILHSGQRQNYELKNVKDSHQIIKTPSLVTGGTYTVTLVSIQDTNGCKTPLEELDATIEVRRDRPSAAFYTIDDQRSVTLIEDSAVDLPLRLQGEGPWNIEYQSPDGKKSLQIQDQNGHFKVNLAGIYRLEEVRDAFCPGVIDKTASGFAVRWFPKPEIAIPESSAMLEGDMLYRRGEVCEGDDDTFDINISGAPPYAVSYERTYLGHKGSEHEKRSLELNVALPVVSIKAKTSPPGTYRYVFRGISDARYDSSEKTQASPLTVEQFINPRPEASFVEPGKVYNYCLEVDLEGQDTDRIPLRFIGEAPFRARFKIKHELSGTTEYLVEQDIRTHTWSLQVPKQILTLGKHVVSIADVSDAKGCSRAFFGKDARIYIAISEQPTILPVSSRGELCVGDRVSYALQGTPPFTIEYDFNGAQKRAVVNGPVFSRVAERPGQFTILSISDSASKCKVNVNGLPKVIHDIPSVRVMEGKTLIESIHEGDQAEIIFHFEGTPPFSLTYTRSEVTKGRHNKILETHSISSIWDHKYTIHSSVAGTFAAMEVHDAHCRISLQN